MPPSDFIKYRMAFMAVFKRLSTRSVPVGGSDRAAVDSCSFHARNERNLPERVDRHLRKAESSRANFDLQEREGCKICAEAPRGWLSYDDFPNQNPHKERLKCEKLFGMIIAPRMMSA